MSAPTLESFFSGGGKSISWRDKPVGTTVTGTITAVHPPAQQVDPADNKPKFRKDGSPQMYVRIDLATNERDPADPEDDGHRGLYVQGFMTGAIGDALRKVGRQGPPEVGAQLTVTLTEREPNANPALNPTNKFAAAYVPPTAAAAGQFFNGQPAQPHVGAPPQPAPQPGFQGAYPPPGGYPQALQPVAQAPVQQAPEPPRPPAISEQAWAAMDAATKQSVAATMNGIPF